MIKIAKEVHVSRKFKIGDRVEGRRTPRIFQGILKGCFFHRNFDNFKVYSYDVTCDDGRVRSFQHIRKTEAVNGIND